MLGGLAEEVRGHADTVAVYVAEAHATDEWPISSARYNGARGPVCLTQARSQSERDAAAAAFCADFRPGFPLVSADIDGLFERTYHPWPIRFFVLDGRRLAFISDPVRCAPDLISLRNFLLENRAEERGRGCAGPGSGPGCAAADGGGVR